MTSCCARSCLRTNLVALIQWILLTGVNTAAGEDVTIYSSPYPIYIGVLLPDNDTYFFSKHLTLPAIKLGLKYFDRRFDPHVR